jgi:hypothetical protein
MQTRARAAFRLKAFETRPGAYDGPSDGSKDRKSSSELFRGTGISGPRELGAGEVGGQATDALIMLCPPQGRKRVLSSHRMFAPP